MSALKSEFASHNSWFTRLTASTAAVALSMLGVSFQASAEPPPPGSPQWKILAPYGGFVTGSKNKDGWSCCHPGDGRAGPEEMPVTAENLALARQTCGAHAAEHAAVNNNWNNLSGTVEPGDYCIKITKELYGEGIPEEGKWIHMPKKRVLDLALWTKDPDGAGPQLSHQKQCEKDAQEKRAAGEKVPATYCDPAPTNLLWYMKGTDQPRCYWPKPRL